MYDLLYSLGRTHKKRCFGEFWGIDGNGFSCSNYDCQYRWECRKESDYRSDDVLDLYGYEYDPYK